MRNKIIELDESSVGIVLDSKKYGEKICIIDREDLPRVKAVNKWYAIRFHSPEFYVAANICKSGSITLHRLILSFPEGLSVDHINGDTLDNRKINLRACTQMDNIKNQRPKSNKPKGVYWLKEKQRWRVEINANRKKYRCGNFKTLKEAAEKYNEMAVKLHGAFARLNIIS